MTNETKNTKTTKKKMFKTNLTVKIISMMMIVLLLTCFTVPTIANAVVVETESVGSNEVTEDGWRYGIDNDGNIAIGKYVGTSEEVTLPSQINGVPVYCVSGNVLQDTPVKKLHISDTDTPYEMPHILKFYRDIFSLSTNLEEIEIGSMLANFIPSYAFSSCPKLKKVTFTEDFTKKAKELGGCYIAHHAFSDCPSLKSFIFPEGITEIAGRAFENDMIENFVFEGYIPNCSLTSMLIKKESLMAIKNIVIFNQFTSVSGKNLTNATFYAPEDSLTQIYVNTESADDTSYIDITTVDIDGFVNSIMNDENPSAPQPIIPPTSSTAETSETSEISETSDITSSTGITGNTEDTEDTSNTGNTEEYSTTATLSPIPSATEGTSNPDDKNELFCVCSYNKNVYINNKISNFRISGNNITYSSNNSNIATVTKNGVISTKKAGRATITANSKTSNTCVKLNLTVKNYPKPKLSKTSLRLKKGHSYTLKISKRMTKATYSSSNKKIATVNKYGKIKASKKKKGTAIITVKANCYTLKCKVKVV